MSSTGAQYEMNGDNLSMPQLPGNSTESQLDRDGPAPGLELLCLSLQRKAGDALTKLVHHLTACIEDPATELQEPPPLTNGKCAESISADTLRQVSQQLCLCLQHCVRNVGQGVRCEYAGGCPNRRGSMECLPDKSRHGTCTIHSHGTCSEVSVQHHLASLVDHSSPDASTASSDAVAHRAAQFEQQPRGQSKPPTEDTDAQGHATAGTGTIFGQQEIVSAYTRELSIEVDDDDGP